MLFTSCSLVLSYIVLAFAKQQAIQRCSQRGKPVKGQVFKHQRDAGEIPGESYSELQGEGHSAVRDQPQQNLGARLQKFATEVQEGQVLRQSEEDDQSDRM